jgi:hypothetical protein
MTENRRDFGGFSGKPIYKELTEAFPKLQFWESNREIRGFARLKA